MNIKTIRKQIENLNLTERTIVYPLKLKELINSGNENIGFVVLIPYTQNFKFIESSKRKKKSKKFSKQENIKEEKIDIGVDAIVLPIKPIEDNLTGSWQSVEGLGLLAGGHSIGKYLSWKAHKGMMGIVSSILPEEVAYAVRLGYFGGIDNPHDALVYAGHQRRTFSLGWDILIPKSKEEEKVLFDIINIFRICSIGGYGEKVIFPPAYWKVIFHSLPNYKNFLRYERVGIQSTSVKFGGNDDNNFQTMENGAPIVSLRVEFNELDYPTRENILIKPSTGGKINKVEQVNFKNFEDKLKK